MGILKRAFLYVTRKKVRSFILFMIFLLMGLFMMAGISIRSSAVKAAEEVRRSLETGIEVKGKPVSGYEIFNVSKNEKGEQVLTPKAAVLTHSKVQEILKIEGVAGYYTPWSPQTVYTGLDVHPGFQAKYYHDMYVSKTTPVLPEMTPEVFHTDMHVNSFYPVEDGRWHPFFANGALELVEGRHIETGDVGKAVISEELAGRNGLQIGDSIESQNYNILSRELFGSVFESEIVGVYRIHFEQRISSETMEENIFANVIFADPEIDHWSAYEYNTYEGREVTAKQADRVIGNLTLFVDDPLLLDSVQEKVQALDTVDWSYYDFERYDRDYKNAASPLLLIVKLSTAMAVFAAVGMFVILSLILTVWVRGRKREMGILSSMGIKRGTTLVQLLAESFLIAVPALLIAGVLAGPLTDGAGNALAKALSPAMSEQAYQTSFDAPTGTLQVDRLATEQVALEYRLTSGMVAAVFLSMLLVMAVSVTIPFLRFAGWKPGDIWEGV